MFEFRDLFQWDRFITPTIIKTFYWLVIALIALFGISGIFSGLAAMAISPFGGFILLLSSIASVIVGVIFSRIAARSATRGKGTELVSRTRCSVLHAAPQSRDPYRNGPRLCSASLRAAQRPGHAQLTSLTY